MKQQKKLTLLISFLLLFLLIPFIGKTKTKIVKKEKPVYTFKIDNEMKRTPVKNQSRTGTCWCFATISFLESELLRMGKGEIDLSEMFVVYHTYPHKALRYIRHHGNTTFGQGGQSHDVFDHIKQYGIVPEEFYTGMNIGLKQHNHSEMSRILKSMLNAVLKRRWGTPITPRWMDAFKAVLEVYLGKPPKSFTFKGKKYSPKSFLKNYLELNLSNYIELTSYSHHPFYKKCCLEIPDNWTYNGNYHNVPIDDLEKIADYALKKGYTICWDGDVSEKDFSSRKTGYAIVPLIDWEDKTEAEKKKKITKSVKEKKITQKMRQKAFDNFRTTDDHLMHIVGIAHDQTGTKFYLTKNSSGTDRKYGGYIYLSRSYFRLKTIAITIHKDVLPPDLRTKMGLN